MAASVGGQLLASSRTVFPATAGPIPPRKAQQEGAAHYPSTARAAMLVQCTGAAPALHCYEAMAKSAQPGPRNSENTAGTGLYGIAKLLRTPAVLLHFVVD